MQQHPKPAYLPLVIWLMVAGTLVSLLFVPIEFIEVRGAVVYSTTPKLRLREAPVINPSDTANVKGKLDPSHPLLVLGETKNSFGWWLNVRDEVTGHEGWAYASYLRATPTVRTATHTQPFGNIAGRRASAGLVRVQMFLRRAQELQLIISLIAICIAVFVRPVVIVNAPQSPAPASAPQPPPPPNTGVSGTRRGHYTNNVYVPRKKNS